MAQAAVHFDDSAAYERLMGRWSRAAAGIFLDWLGARPGANWLDVGCDTGILAETLLELCAPASVHAVDAAPAQIQAAARSPAAGRATPTCGTSSRSCRPAGLCGGRCAAWASTCRQSRAPKRRALTRYSPFFGARRSSTSRLMRAVQSTLPAGPNGSIEYCARANAIKGRVPR